MSNYNIDATHQLALTSKQTGGIMCAEKHRNIIREHDQEEYDNKYYNQQDNEGWVTIGLHKAEAPDTQAKDKPETILEQINITNWTTSQRS